MAPGGLCQGQALLFKALFFSNSFSFSKTCCLLVCTTWCNGVSSCLAKLWEALRAVLWCGVGLGVRRLPSRGLQLAARSEATAL